MPLKRKTAWVGGWLYQMMPWIEWAILTMSTRRFEYSFMGRVKATQTPSQWMASIKPMAPSLYVVLQQAHPRFRCYATWPRNTVFSIIGFLLSPGLPGPIGFLCMPRHQGG